MNKPGLMMVAASVLTGWILPLVAHAADVPNPPRQVQTKEKAVKPKKTAGKTSFSSGSQETSTERNARLQRECKGAVNAGACSGYTQ